MTHTSEAQQRSSRVASSMLWAAWADALGFISELTDEPGLRRRLGDHELDRPVTWQRRVGGKFGANATLPTGCYSDDTQLRLATGRAISRRGFDAEAFAKIELPVWPAYALGGGRASKAAAAHLSKPATPWFGNFFDGYTDAGGNGAAMRIQPHVWAAPDPAGYGPHLLDVIIDAAITHGHPRALIGAVLHATTLGWAVQHGSAPEPPQWDELLKITAAAVQLIGDSEQLATLWAPTWEKTTRRTLDEAWLATIEECDQLLATATPIVEKLRTANIDHRSQIYQHLIGELRLTQPDNRGSGTATTVAATALAAAYPQDPRSCAQLAASTLDTDTDTIATMAAAIAGANDSVDHPTEVLDQEHLQTEAGRLAALALGARTRDFTYPDLLHWTPPRSQLDAVGLVDDRPALAGLGYWTPLDDTVVEVKTAQWRWVATDFGPSLLLKHRRELRPLPDGNHPQRRSAAQTPTEARRVSEQPELDLHHNEGVPTAVRESRTAPPTTGRGAEPTDGHDARGVANAQPRTDVELDQILGWIERKNYDDAAIGYAMRRVAELGTSDQLIALTSALRSAIRGSRRT